VSGGSVNRWARPAEGSLAEREDLLGRHREEEGLPAIGVLQGALAELGRHSPYQLVAQAFGQPLEPVGRRDAVGIALDDDVEPALPVVAARRQDTCGL
jgi:hypothetical protein